MNAHVNHTYLTDMQGVMQYLEGFVMKADFAQKGFNPPASTILQQNELQQNKPTVYNINYNASGNGARCL
jgi:hypothetical protein